MLVSTHIIPRRVVLFLLVLAALALRLWGLGWGPSGAGALHPGEWTWQVIDSLSLSNPTYPGIWTQAFFSLAALVKGALSALLGWLQLLLGQARSMGEVEVSARMAGRLTVALLGTGQVVLVYVVGRRYFDSVATGLLAAALVAVSPLLVAHSHYLALDVPLGLAVLGCMWAAWLMVDRPGWPVMALAGLILGLTITTRASGVLAAPVLLGAYYLAVRVARPARSRWLMIWPGAFLGGFLLGLMLGYPGFVLRAEHTQEVMETSLSLPPVPPGDWLAFMAERWRRSLAVAVESVGLVVVGLWLAGLVLVLKRRTWRRALLLFFPPLYFVAGLVMLKGSVEGVSAVWLPVLMVVVAWPVVWACRKLPRYRLAVLAALLVGGLLCVWPLWRSLGVNYLFWQQDTLSTARQWVQANLDAPAKLWVGPHTPLGVFLPTEPLEPGTDLKQMGPHGFVALSSLGAGARADSWQDFTPPASQDLWKDLPRRLQPLAVFDLKDLWSAGPRDPGAGLPRWVSPQVRLFAARPPLLVNQPLALFKPPAQQDGSYGLVYGDWDRYSRNLGVMRLKAGAVAERVLILKRQPARLGLVLANRGEDLARVTVSQGPWPSQEVSLYPGQETQLNLPVLAWPPVVSGCYPVTVRSSGGGLVARLVWDQLLLGRRALEDGRLQEALAILPQVFKENPGVESGAMLAGALALKGQYEAAGKVLSDITGLGGEPVRSYQDLAMDKQQSRPDWDQAFKLVCGYYPDLLRGASSLTYQVGGPTCPSDGSEVPLRGRGYHASFMRPAGKPGGHLKLWLTQPFPRGRLRVDLELSAKGPLAGHGRLGRAEVWTHGPHGSIRLAGSRITGAQARAGRKVMGFYNPVSGATLELRLIYTSSTELKLQRVTVGVDLPGHMRHLLRWYHYAQGRVALAAGRFPEAVEAFGQVLTLDSAFSYAYLPLARSLMDAGKVDQALAMLHRAEARFSAQPAGLQKVAELYGAMKKPEDLARVEKRLAHLRPSLKKQARFAGGLSLLGYDLAKSQVAPGGKLEVSYYWRCWSPPPVNYFVFVHLRGPGVVYNYDHLLEHGQRSMTSLKKGQVVREDYQVYIPSNAPPGRYRLVVGLWDPRFTGKAVAVTGGAGEGSEEVELTTLQVK